MVTQRPRALCGRRWAPAARRSARTSQTAPPSARQAKTWLQILNTLHVRPACGRPVARRLVAWGQQPDAAGALRARAGSWAPARPPCNHSDHRRSECTAALRIACKAAGAVSQNNLTGIADDDSTMQKRRQNPHVRWPSAAGDGARRAPARRGGQVALSGRARGRRAGAPAAGCR